MALLEQVWAHNVIKTLRLNETFLGAAQDMSSLVEYNKIHLPIQGNDPAVQLDTTYTSATAVSDKEVITETSKEITLHAYNTKQTVIRDLDLDSITYDKIALINGSHVDAIRETFLKYCARTYAPASNTNDTPVVPTKGAARTGSAVKKFSFEDIIVAATHFDERNYSTEGRSMIICPKHAEELRIENLPMYNQLMLSGTLFGFKVYFSNVLPKYNSGTGAKLNAGVTTNQTDASIFVHKRSIMYAKGSLKAFVSYNNPDLMGTGIAYRTRFTADRIFDKGLYAVYSK